MFKSWLSIFIVLCIIGIIEYYFIAAIKTSFPSFWEKHKKKFLTIYVIISCLFWLILFFFRSAFVATLPQSIRTFFIVSLFGTTVSKLFIGILLMIDDLRRGIIWIFRKINKKSAVKTHSEEPIQRNNRISRSSFLSRIALGIGGVSFGIIAWGTTNKYRYQHRKINLNISGLPKNLDGLKIIQISDVHAGSLDDIEKVNAGIDLILAQKPDLIVFTGDLVNNQSEEIKPFLSVFNRLNAPLGVYAILGNHDYGDYIEWPSEADKAANLEQLKQHIKDMGWQLLLNEHKLLKYQDTEFALIGVENWSESPRFPKKGDIQKAYQGLDNTTPLKVLLTHDPSHWNKQITNQYKDIQLTLSGHTHGMQFGIDIPGFRWSPVKYVYRQWLDLYKEEKQYIYVNRGFGFIGYPGRIGILPEITQITIRS